MKPTLMTHWLLSKSVPVLFGMNRSEAEGVRRVGVSDGDEVAMGTDPMDLGDDTEGVGIIGPAVPRRAGEASGPDAASSQAARDASHE